MVQMPNIQRAKKLLDNLRCLWRHPGVSDAQRQRLVLEVFDQVRIRGKEIVAIRPKAQYEPHFAYMALAKQGLLVWETGFEPATPSVQRL